MLDGNMRTETDPHTSSITNPSSMSSSTTQVQVNQELMNADSGDSPAVDQIGGESELLTQFSTFSDQFFLPSRSCS